MVGFLARGNYLRQGTLGLGVYLPNTGGTPISAAPTIGGVTFDVFGASEVLVRSSNKLFNLGYTTPGSQRTFKAVFECLDTYGQLSYTDASTGTNGTPGATDNIAFVSITGIPAGVLRIFIFVDNQLANIVPVISSIRDGSTGAQVVPVYYEPIAGKAFNLNDLSAIQTGETLYPATLYALPDTTGALTHTINFTKIDVPINDLPNTMITTRSNQQVEATFVGPQSYVQALFSGGTAGFACGCATVLTQLGFRSGGCNGNRVFRLVFPGDACGEQFDALLIAEAIQGTDSQAVEYSSENVSNLPVTLREAALTVHKGQHSLTLQAV